MKKSELFEKLSFPIVKLYMQCENDLLLRIVAALKRGGIYATDFSLNWNLQKLNDMGGLTKGAITQISATSKKAKKLLEDILTETALKSLAENGVDGSITEGVKRTITALQARANNALNLVNTQMLTAFQDAYSTTLVHLENTRNKVLNESIMRLTTGQTAFQEELRNVIVSLADEGINAYVDKRGRVWSPEAYVSMDLRTTCADVARESIQEQGRDYGLDVILVSSHAGARPGCAPYQGKCYSMSGRSGTITDINGNKWEFEPISVTGYNPASGTNSDPAGLFGVNCGHFFRYIEEGLFVNNQTQLDTKAQIEANEKEYALSQEQRAIEREIRFNKRKAEMLSAIGDEKGASIYSGAVKSGRAEYREFCKATGRTERWDRTQIF